MMPRSREGTRWFKIHLAIQSLGLSPKEETVLSGLTIQPTSTNKKISWQWSVFILSVVSTLLLFSGTLNVSADDISIGGFQPISFSDSVAIVDVAHNTPITSNPLTAMEQLANVIQRPEPLNILAISFSDDNDSPLRQYPYYSVIDEKITNKFLSFHTLHVNLSLIDSSNQLAHFNHHIVSAIKQKNPDYIILFNGRKYVDFSTKVQLESEYKGKHIWVGSDNEDNEILFEYHPEILFQFLNKLDKTKDKTYQFWFLHNSHVISSYSEIVFRVFEQASEKTHEQGIDSHVEVIHIDSKKDLRNLLISLNKEQNEDVINIIVNDLQSLFDEQTGRILNKTQIAQEISSFNRKSIRVKIIGLSDRYRRGTDAVFTLFMNPESLAAKIDAFIIEKEFKTEWPRQEKLSCSIGISLTNASRFGLISDMSYSNIQNLLESIDDVN